MARNRKYFPNRSVILVTSRTEEDLPIVSSYILNFIVWGILAKARSMYSVKVCHFVFMANHFHMILVVDCPQHVPLFVGYIKAEIAHAINRMLGRRQKTIWQDGYDSPVLLTEDEIRKYIKYIYQNPSKARLVHSIDEYPGVSSWEMFKCKKQIKQCKKLSRDDIPKLNGGNISINEQKRILEKLENYDLKSFEFILEPDAWRESFPNSFDNQEIIDEIEKEEEQIRSQRIRKNIGVVGVANLRTESMSKKYAPKKFSKRMICICSFIELRKAFIESYKYLCSQASKAYENWKNGNYTSVMPPGMFSPRRPEFASSLSIY